MTRAEPLAILIVEDERVVARDLEEMLGDLGYRVTGVVSSGAEALHSMNREPAQLILLDIRINGPLDGIDVAVILRRRFEVQVVYLTAHTDEVTTERAQETQPLGYLSKPIHIAELQAVIGRAAARIASQPRSDV